MRKAACLAAGGSLRDTNDLKEFRSPLLKCMRATEDSEVHWALARGLAIAARRHSNLFLNKSGLALIDGALMLSQTASRKSVKQEFHRFLFAALRMEGDTGLKEYKRLAGESNGKIMTQLANTALSNLNVSQDDDFYVHRLRTSSQ